MNIPKFFWLAIVGCTMQAVDLRYSPVGSSASSSEDEGAVLPVSAGRSGSSRTATSSTSSPAALSGDERSMSPHTMAVAQLAIRHHQRMRAIEGAALRVFDALDVLLARQAGADHAAPHSPQEHDRLLHEGQRSRGRTLTLLDTVVEGLERRAGREDTLNLLPTPVQSGDNASDAAGSDSGSR